MTDNESRQLVGVCLLVDSNAMTTVDRRLIDELATGRFLHDGRNVVLLGPPGVDKTPAPTARSRRAAATLLANEPLAPSSAAASPSRRLPLRENLSLTATDDGLKMRFVERSRTKWVNLK